MKLLFSRVDQAAEKGYLLPSTAENIHLLLRSDCTSLTRESVTELLKEQRWEELNDRFFRTLGFGTGGLRGKTIRPLVTRNERGSSPLKECPQFPCVGTNTINDFNIARATRGLAEHIKELFEQQGLEERPKICIAHDTRHFSRRFSELCARVLVEEGCDAFLFTGSRSTPELSFAVRYLQAAAGINITASHNPPEYSGFKVYWSDGAQIMEPHTGNIISRINRVIPRDAPYPDDEGEVVALGEEIDNAYLERLKTLILDQELVHRQAPFTKIVYTPLHGTGMAIIPKLLHDVGFALSVVASQQTPDGQFPTVTSPNPEDPEALSLAIQEADDLGADVVIGTDPDGDRMGVAARSANGKMQHFTGNQIGSLLLWYRLTKLFELGILNEKNRSHAVCLKTFVTTDLQKAIAEHFGVRCVDTLTGFKYIGAKLRKYEKQIPQNRRANYSMLSEEKTRNLRLNESSYYVFGGEESYGYSASDFVRDKDANSSALMLGELAAFAKEKSTTLHGLLDEIFRTFGVYFERGKSMVFDGAEGATKIRNLVASYADDPPPAIAGSKVMSARNFAKETIRDVEGDLIPKESMMIFETQDHCRVAVRPSGTEPKIKYYLFAAETPKSDSFLSDRENMVSLKQKVEARLDEIWKFLEEDAKARLK
ncbi:MAG: phosphomannomutase [Verrucomicrobia bacterium]|nr:MAG: phosphomannomutase [Verrucomicrobiota bacterium]